MALSEASKTTQWLRSLLIEMEFEEWVSKPTRVYGDNDAATQLAREDILTINNRYYAKNSHYSKKAFLHGITNPVRVPGTENLADGLTKALPSATHEKLSPMLKGYKPISEASSPSGEPFKIKPRDKEDTLDSHITDKTVRERLRKDALINIYKTPIHPAVPSATKARMTRQFREGDQEVPKENVKIKRVSWKQSLASNEPSSRRQPRGRPPSEKKESKARHSATQRAKQRQAEWRHSVVKQSSINRR
jgi:hypothetical protein